MSISQSNCSFLIFELFAFELFLLGERKASACLGYCPFKLHSRKIKYFCEPIISNFQHILEVMCVCDLSSKHFIETDQIPLFIIVAEMW